MSCNRFGTFARALISDGRSDIAVAAARQCLDPIFAAGFFRKRSVATPQSGPLSCFLDRKPRPGASSINLSLEIGVPAPSTRT